MTATTASELFVLDSSGWLEYVTADTNASQFAPYIENAAPLLVPTIVLYEVYKKLFMDRGQTMADRFASHVMRHIVIPLDENLALAAAGIGATLRLDMADSIIYATGQARGATVVTGDEHFRGLPGVILV